MKKLLPIMLFTCLSLQGCLESSASESNSSGSGSSNSSGSGSSNSSGSGSSNSSGSGSSNSSGSGPSNSSGSGSSNSSGSISCNVKVGTVVKITKDKWPEHSKACSNISTGFMWGSDGDLYTSGTPEGACKGAFEQNKDYSYPPLKTACYCYVTENVSAASALPNGVWMCWAGH